MRGPARRTRNRLAGGCLQPDAGEAGLFADALTWGTASPPGDRRHSACTLLLMPAGARRSQLSAKGWGPGGWVAHTMHDQDASGAGQLVRGGGVTP